MDQAAAILSNFLLFFLVFGLSATVRLQDLQHQLTNKFAILTGVAMQFLIMPFLGFCSVMIFRNYGFTEAMGISLLVVTASPGGSYSNWWCNLFNAELALSVAMTSVSSIISLGLLPANLFFYSWLAYTVIVEPDEDAEDLNILDALDFDAIFITLGVVLGAIIIGLFVGYKVENPNFRQRVNGFGSFCGVSLIFLSAFLGSGGGDAEATFWTLPPSFYLGTALPCIVGMALANILSRSFRLTPPEVVAISIECCYQNTGIATSVAATMFTDPNERAEAISVPLFYGLVEAFIIGIYCLWAWKVGWTKAPSDEKLCVVVTKTYEVENEDNGCDDDLDELPEGWFARLFVPRAVERKISGEHTAKLDDHANDEPRARFESADVTVATMMVSPPGTPENSLETILDSSSQDIETPSCATPTLLYSKFRTEGKCNDYPMDERSHSNRHVQSMSISALEPSDETVLENNLDLPRGPSHLPRAPSQVGLSMEESSWEENPDSEEFNCKEAHV